MTPKTPITVKLTGEDGNVYNLIGKVVRSLTKAGYQKEAEQFKKEALASQSYTEVLQLIFQYVDVE